MIDLRIFLPNKVLEERLNIDEDYLDSYVKKLIRDYSFCLIEASIKDKIIIYTDHICSIPFFYTDEKIIINSEIHDTKINLDNINEKYLYKASGFCLSNETLDKKIKCGLPGRKYIFSNKLINEETFIKNKLFNRDSSEFDENSAREKLDDILNHCFKKIKNNLQGNLIIPLSGGYDSRILLYYAVKILGKDRVRTFTYGKKNNVESLKSKEIAEAFQVKWKFVEYSKDLIKSSKKDLFDFLKSNYKIRSVPHIQDFLAIKKLIDTSYINNEDIIMPGHSGDFLFGSHLTDYFDEDQIIKKHYREKNISAKKVKEHLNTFYSFRSNLDSMNFNYENRQSKYVVNSVRVYESFSLDWFLPFWQYDLVQLASTIPEDFLINRRFQLSFCDHLMKDMTFKNNNPTEFKRFPMLRRVVGLIPFRKSLYRFVRTFDNISHFLNFNKFLNTRIKFLAFLHSETHKGSFIRISLDD